MASPLPQHTPEEQLLTKLDVDITRHQLTGNFSCGGRLPVAHHEQHKYGNFTSAKRPFKCPGVIVSWTAGNVPKCMEIGTSVNIDQEKAGLNELVQDCYPATFGHESENVFDENVRKAGTINSFLTNFDPYSFGVIDTIGKELLPGITRAGKQTAIERWGIVAEPYHLNVYSAPSGMFKAHVDTPRGRTHFGSLVVILPTKFSGGQLRVSHNEREEIYSGSSLYPSYDIHWAAFYSDCEHEVLPVTDGHRVTLTYHLYVYEQIGGLIQPQIQPLDSKYSSLYQGAVALLESPAFMKSGGILGFHCAYQYPETFEGTHYYERYPLTLKGIDFIVFTIFRSLGLTVHIKPRESGMIGGALSSEPPPENLDRGYYIGDEIFNYVQWLNNHPKAAPAGEGHLAQPKPFSWIGNEIEIDWDYAFRALLVVIPSFPDRLSRFSRTQ
ncbi:uncharacterized protein F4822DRAFT_142430 [Hypoxylon trugodes]|uniref:uncharacterized protein n=1 Tax=Hypoxylon trugodes TaxID=326681 RepID=UPI002196426E|nr:uncharacterized protein F4822DRAFT_142430 [Hypoxylon trugodes]KAI1392833.1 hypothetical protein F4822DRAFT_142430 [Hypoxylon trugodes]